MINRLLLALFLLSSIACNRNVLGHLTKGMSVYGKQEFWYTLHSDHPHAEKPAVGDQVHINYTMSKGDKILSHSYNSRRPILVQIPQPTYDNFFTKAIRLMSEGDSLEVLIEAVKAKDLLGEFDSEFNEKDIVKFTYKMYEIKTATAFEKDLREEIKRIESNKDRTFQLIKRFENGELTDSLKKSPEGLQYIIHQEGEGKKAAAGHLVQVHYVCYLADGTELQDSYQNMTPLEFIVGDNTVIDGWSIGISLLKEGSSATLFIPPNLGYGEKGMGEIIPPNSTLIFFVELLYVH